jgi:Mitochondrial carrier protein
MSNQEQQQGPASTTTLSSAAAAAPANNNGSKPKKQSPLFHLVAGGCAGFVESSVCHPLDTIKTR